MGRIQREYSADDPDVLAKVEVNDLWGLILIGDDTPKGIEQIETGDYTPYEITIVIHSGLNT